MDVRHPLSRRRFFGGVAAAMGVLGLRPSSSLFAQGQTAQFRGSDAEYDYMRQVLWSAAGSRSESP